MATRKRDRVSAPSLVSKISFYRRMVDRSGPCAHVVSVSVGGIIAVQMCAEDSIDRKQEASLMAALITPRKLLIC